MSKRILRKKEVLAKTGLGPSRLYELVAEGTFPRQVRLGLKSVGWIESEVDGWIDERVRIRDSAPAKRKRRIGATAAAEA